MFVDDRVVLKVLNMILYKPFNLLLPGPFVWKSAEGITATTCLLLPPTPFYPGIAPQRLCRCKVRIFTLFVTIQVVLL